MDTKPTTAEIVIMAGGVVTLLFSFFNFVTSGDDGSSAWAAGLRPLATLPALIGLAMGGVIALTRFGNVRLPHDVLGFTWKQVHLVLGFYALLLMVGFLLTDTADKGFGFWMMLLGSIALFVGAFMYMKEGDSVSSPGSTTPPTPF